MRESDLTCGYCGADNKINPLILKAKTAAGLPYQCSECREDLGEFGYKPRRGKTDAQKRSRQQEKRAAKRTGGKLTPGSGNQPGAKGDVRVMGSVRIECKCTTAESFRLKLEDLMKIERAGESGENPILEIEFQGVHPKRRYVVLPGWLYDHYASLSGDQ